MQNFKDLIKNVVENGVKKPDRTGTGTTSIFSSQLQFDLRKGFPLVTIKETKIKNIILELLFFLRGDTNSKILEEQGCNIWKPWAYIEHGPVEIEFLLIDSIVPAFNNWKDDKNLIKDMSDEVFVQLKNIEKSDLSFEEKIDAYFILKDIYELTGESFADVDFQSLLKEDYASSLEHFIYTVCIKYLKDVNFLKPISSLLNKYSYKGLKPGDLGPVYGKQWREFGQSRYYGDQIKSLVNKLKNNPDDRRMVVSAWNPTYHPEDGLTHDENIEKGNMVLPPCHFAFQVYTEEVNGVRYLDLKFHMRSVDVLIGLPYNIASYATLAMMLAHHTGMVARNLIWDGTNVHIYNDQLFAVQEILSREPKTLPTLKIKASVEKDLWDYSVEDFELIGYEAHPFIKLPVAI